MYVSPSFVDYDPATVTAAQCKLLATVGWMFFLVKPEYGQRLEIYPHDYVGLRETMNTKPQSLEGWSLVIVPPSGGAPQV